MNLLLILLLLSNSATAAAANALAALNNYVFFTNCYCSSRVDCPTGPLRIRQVEACKKDLLSSPFDTIIFSFAGGAVYGKGDSRCKKSQNYTCINPFSLEVDWYQIGVLSPSFVDALHARGKQAMLSFGGGDPPPTKTYETFTGTAIPRTFTSLWRRWQDDKTTLPAWVSYVVAFAEGNNSAGVAFDGMNWDVEESHAVSNPDWEPYKTPLGDELLTNRSGVQFYAQLLLAVRKVYAKPSSITMQPAYFMPPLGTPVYAYDNCANQTDPAKPLDWPLPRSCSNYTASQNFVWMFSQYPALKTALSGVFAMLYPATHYSLGAWKNGTWFDNSTQQFDLPSIAKNIANFEFRTAESKQQMSLGDLVVLTTQTQFNSSSNPAVSPPLLSQQLSAAASPIQAVAIWGYNGTFGSCTMQRFLSGDPNHVCFASLSHSYFADCLFVTILLWAVIMLLWALPLPDSVRQGFGASAQQTKSNFVQKRDSFKGKKYLRARKFTRGSSSLFTRGSSSLDLMATRTLSVEYESMLEDCQIAGMETESAATKLLSDSVAELLNRSIEFEKDQHYREAQQISLSFVSPHFETCAKDSRGRLSDIFKAKAVQLRAREAALGKKDEHALRLAHFQLREGILQYTAILNNCADFSRLASHNFVQDSATGGILIVVTMYNEPRDILEGTLLNVGRCIYYMQQMNSTCNGEQLSPDAVLQKVTVLLVLDGRAKLDEGSACVLEDSRLFDTDLVQMALLGDSRPQLHLFEGPMVFENEDNNGETVEISTMVALKEKNAGKLSSHAWALQGFATQLNPTYAVLLDVGTKPSPPAIHRLIRAMELRPNVGGVCGEIAVDRPFDSFTNVLIGAQHFEYKVSHILDKAMESVFGFVTVLPGAFCAYRMAAVQGKPLDEYFKAISGDLTPMQGNMYLAEDRLMCFELLAKKNASWILHFVNNATARTDVPDTLVALIKQRRRWLNGSYIALVYALTNFKRFYTDTSHSPLRKLAISFHVGYLWVASVFVSFVLPALFFLVIDYILVIEPQLNISGEVQQWTGAGVSWIEPALATLSDVFLFIVAIHLLISLGARPEHFENTFKVTAALLALIMTLTLAAIIAEFTYWIQSTGFVVASLPFFVFLALVVSPFIAALLHGIGQFFHLALFALQYLLFLPTFTISFGLYAFSNLHDLSWGTKGQDKHTHASENGAKARVSMEDQLKIFRTKTILAYATINMAIVVLSRNLDPSGGSFIKFVVYFAAAVNFVRLVGAVIYLTKQWICSCCCQQREGKSEWFRTTGRSDPEALVQVPPEDSEAHYIEMK